jgi:hypothetical protein
VLRPSFGGIIFFPLEVYCHNADFIHPIGYAMPPWNIA